MTASTQEPSPAEIARREKIASTKRGKPRSPETRAKLSAAKTGVRQVARGEDEVTLEELKAFSGRGYKVLAGWRDSGDAPGRWVAQPGEKPDVFLFDRDASVERFTHECERPACRWPALRSGERCAQHQDLEDAKRSIAELAAGAGITRWWLSKLLHDVRPELYRQHRPMTSREFDELFEGLPRCQKRGCENPAGPTGRCWIRGHYAWLRPRPTFQKFGRASEERQCPGCGKWRIIRGWQLARGKGERCASCTVEHFFADLEQKARWALRRHGLRSFRRLIGGLGREGGKRGGRTAGKVDELSREMVERVIALDQQGRSQREIASDLEVSRAKVQRLLAHVRKVGAEATLRLYPAA